MIPSPRLVSLSRIPFRFECVSSRPVWSAHTCRLLCYEPKWLCFSTEGKDPLGPHRTAFFHQPILVKKSQLTPTIQIYRYNSLKAKEERSANPESDSTKLKAPEEVDDLEQFKKLSLYEKIKAMYRDYWYVLAPVHIVSSLIFFGAFYYTASSGVDIIAILESLHFSEKVVSSLRDSSAGYIAIAYALYKIFTPIRYTVTLGGTTWAIRFLRSRGLIKPRRPMKEAKENMQNIISAMKLPEKERQKFLEEKGMPRIGKAVSSLASKTKKEK